MMSEPGEITAPNFMAGGGVMGQKMRTHAWAATPLGPPERWPQSLRTVVGLLLTSSFPMFAVWGPDLTFFYNDAYRPILGSKPEALGRPFREVWADIWDVLGQLVERALAGEATFREDQLLVMERHGYREETYFTFSYSPVFDETGRAAGMFCACTETTSKVLGERRAAFRLALEEKLRDFSDPLEIAAAAEEALGRYLGVSRVGYGTVDEEEMRFFTTERNWTDGAVASHVGTHDLAAFGTEVLMALRRGDPLVIQDAATDPRTNSPERLAAFAALEMSSVITASLVKDGRMVAALYVHNRLPRRWRADQVELVQEVAERTWSAIERARAESLLRAERDRSREVLESIAEGFLVLDRNFRVVEINAEGLRLEQRPAAEIVGRVVWEAWPGSENSAIGQAYKRAMRERAPAFVEHRYDWADGRHAWLEARIFPSGAGLAVFYRDVSERKQAEDALRDLNVTLERRVAERTADRDRMWRLSTDIMLVARYDTTITAVNPAWTSLLGWAEDELLGRSFLDFVHPDDRDVTAEEAGRLSPARANLRHENRYRHKDGSFRWISWVAVPDRGLVHGVGRDVTAEKDREASLRQAEDQLRQAQKMEAVGQLTGGVAHDFNNLLQALGGCLAMIGRRTAEPRVRPMLEAGQQAVERGAKLVQQLMAFSRRESLRPEPIDIRDRVLAMSGLLERALRADIAVVTSFGSDLWPVELDPTQFELTLLNLAVNARDAMPGGGRLAIHARNITLHPGDPTGLAGDFVCLSVADSGTGMSPEVAARAFDPFFTTKEVGKGSGLGLAQVYGLARQAGGTAWIESEEGLGTTVHLLLHRSEQAARAVEPDRTLPGLERQGGHMLLVEDDPVVASTVTAALEDAGWTVTRVGTADDAVPLLAGSSRFDVLFSDVVTPGTRSGVDLAHECRRLRPGLPVVLTTGYSEEGARAENIEVLPKPYSLDALFRALAAAIGGT